MKTFKNFVRAMRKERYFFDGKLRPAGNSYWTNKFVDKKTKYEYEISAVRSKIDDQHLMTIVMTKDEEFHPVEYTQVLEDQLKRNILHLIKLESPQSISIQGTLNPNTDLKIRYLLMNLKSKLMSMNYEMFKGEDGNIVNISQI